MIHDLRTAVGNSAAEDQLVEIASGILLGSLSDQLIPVWLKPEFE
jgi:hypothetical protein